jgi:3-hydroxyisobutyrate dehydrogenase-like beta-hydroxyacid dehydrogenase
MSTPCVGIIGLGEVGLTFGLAMAETGAEVLGYDVRFVEPGGSRKQELPAVPGIRPVAYAELFSRAAIILSTVTTDVALEAARSAVPYLSGKHIYVDLNSTSRAAKMRLAEVVSGSGARFVEGAILGAVGASGAKTRVILTGPAAQEIAETLNGLGLNCEEFGQQFGDGASFKMLRSIFSKGLEALLLEMLAAARRAGLEDEVWSEIAGFMASHPFEKVARSWIESHAVAYERRYYEMAQVVETLHELDVEPLMSEATLAFFKRSLGLGLDEAFRQKPESAEEVIRHFAEQLQPAATAYAP